MAAYLITHSLLSSWLHLIRENPYEDLTTEGDPLAEFMLVLKREPTPRTEAMQNGIDFENLVTAIVNGHDDPNNPWSWAAGQIAAIVNGGQLQFKARRKIQVRGMDVWTECYRRDETPDICPIIADFFDWLDAFGLMDVFKEHWKAL